MLVLFQKPKQQHARQHMVREKTTTRRELRAIVIMFYCCGTLSVFFLRWTTKHLPASSPNGSVFCHNIILRQKTFTLIYLVYTLDTGFEAVRVRGVIASDTLGDRDCFGVPDGATKANIFSKLIAIINRNPMKLQAKNPQGQTYTGVAGKTSKALYTSSRTELTIDILTA